MVSLTLYHVACQRERERVATCTSQGVHMHGMHACTLRPLHSGMCWTGIGDGIEFQGCIVWVFNSL